jgi:serine/threonine protein kinase
LPVDLDCTSPPLDHFSSIHRLSTARSGHASWEHARHQLYFAHDKRTRAHVLIKITSKPGLVYEQELTNEIASLSTINRELPDSQYFPVLAEHGHLRDGRLYLTMSLFDEWPLATAIRLERAPSQQTDHLRTAIEVARALEQLHGLRIWHVDLNPMNILSRQGAGRPVVRIVDFESSYEEARHSRGVFYDPPTTAGFSAPELSGRVPDARSDLFSLGAVLYTMLAGYGWTWADDIAGSVRNDRHLAESLKEMLLSAVDANPGRRLPSVAEFRVHCERMTAE